MLAVVPDQRLTSLEDSDGVMSVLKRRCSDTVQTIVDYCLLDRGVSRVRANLEVDLQALDVDLLERKLQLLEKTQDLRPLRAVLHGPMTSLLAVLAELVDVVIGDRRTVPEPRQCLPIRPERARVSETNSFTTASDDPLLVD